MSLLSYQHFPRCFVIASLGVYENPGIALGDRNGGHVRFGIARDNHNALRSLTNSRRIWCVFCGVAVIDDSAGLLESQSIRCMRSSTDIVGHICHITISLSFSLRTFYTDGEGGIL